ncbi:pyridoxal phosphate-dependent decarboxylase family protein [Histidinibacterium lentulum]|uniref:Aminotransferase class V-fold PLP-dependent enzyme n=1 Tax=Histidinibacterium lentulum TaxID=2480588 RepID=A0A3N2QW43_9RHOB|nr:aminotransferase class V-fold PLP-dependent enzyme [Histidinibacterium lentulum]ROT99461.1 aminotransferase class V-fold PLP-dependent enzyme [Histidinibacterium lentulum]
MTHAPAFASDPAALSAMLGWAETRIRTGPDPRSGALPRDRLDAALGGSVTAGGLGWDRAFALFSDVIAPSCRPFDHPTSLAFVAAAPTPAAQGFDAVLGAAEIFAGNWDGGSGAIHAENQALDWLAGLAGWGDGAGGVFVSGGTMGNLSALHAARVAFEQAHGRPERFRLLASTEAHSSIAAIARVMDVALDLVPADATGRIDVEAAKDALRPGTFAIVANAGATNSGAVDDLAALADLAEARGLWLHVDGAYGLAALADPGTAPLFAGLELADSFIVDPHKWLFAPYDSCALVYRDVTRGAAAHGQRGAYLDALDTHHLNPSDLALHLSRRPRGLPLWFSLSVYGTEAYAAAIRRTFRIAQEIADGIEAMPGLDLVLGPQLTVLLFRVPGMDRAALQAWAEGHRRSGALLCLPTTWRGETVLRICVVNPETDPTHVLRVLETLT